MRLAYHTVNTTIKALTQVLCRIESESLRHVPSKGPLILVCNHVNFLDVPVLYTRLLPRPVTGLAKAETWQDPVLGPLFELWGGIPIRRGEADTSAIRLALTALSQGKIVAIAPEGTRSGTGILQQGHSGIVSVALHSKAPLLPLVYYGGETFHQNVRKLRRTDFHIRVGKPFYLKIPEQTLVREIRQRITDEIMLELAALLPQQYHGFYTNMQHTSRQYLQYIE